MSKYKTSKFLVSVVIPTFNEEKYICKCMDSFAKQTLSPKEIIIVDGDSEDKTIDFVKTYIEKFKKRGTDLRIVIESKLGIIRARDLGFRFAKGEIVASCDADNIYPSNFLKIACSRIKNDFVAVAGRNLVNNPPWYIVVERKLAHWRDTVFFFLFKTCFYPRASNLVFLRQSYLKTPGMDLKTISAEDEFGMAKLLNTQGKIYYEPKMLPLSSSRRFNQGGLLYFLLKTIIYDYWLGYIRTKYFGSKVIYPRAD